MSNPILKSNWNLLIDDHVLSRVTGFDRVIHHPRPVGVVLPSDKPWETAGSGMAFVDRREDGTFFAYYRAMWWEAGIADALEDGTEDIAHHISSAVAYATSEDGVHWDKSALTLMEGPADTDWSCAPYPQPIGNSSQNNLGVPLSFLVDLGRHGNVSDPSRRYALRLAPLEAHGVGSHWQYSPRGYFASEIPDFLNDPDWQDKLIDSGGNFNPRRNMVHFWDDIHHEWVAMEQGVVGHWLPSRDVARMASKDLVNWTSEVALYPDAADSHTPQRYDEPMSLTPFCAEGMVFGLLSWFHSDRSHPDGGPNLETTEEHPFRWPWCRKGINEMRITTSRDGGKTWDRTSSREAWIPHGTEHDSYDRLVIGALPPLQIDDEDWFYVNVINGDHLGIRNARGSKPYYHDRLPRHQTALYIQKHNRYVSLRANNQREILITKPMMLQGDSLQLNVDASRGEVQVGIALAEPVGTFSNTTPSTAPHLLEGRMIEGFTFDDCEMIHANSVEHAVRFKDKANIGSLTGKPICLLFRMFDANLYGFRAI